MKANHMGVIDYSIISRTDLTISNEVDFAVPTIIWNDGSDT